LVLKQLYIGWSFLKKTPGREKPYCVLEPTLNRVPEAPYSKLGPIGSVLREDFRPESDVDVLVEFEQGHVPGRAFFSMERELSEILTHKVDLNTPQFLSPYVRDRILAETEAHYVAA